MVVIRERPQPTTERRVNGTLCLNVWPWAITTVWQIHAIVRCGCKEDTGHRDRSAYCGTRPRGRSCMRENPTRRDTYPSPNYRRPQTEGRESAVARCSH